MLNILHLADLHLGWVPRFMPTDKAAERARRRDSLLRRAVDFALAPGSGVGLVVIAGDLFETHRPAGALVASVLAELRRLTAAGIPLVTVPGNHDEITYHDSVYRQRSAEWPGLLVQNPHAAHASTLTAGGLPVHVYSLAYTGGITQTRPPISSFPRQAEPGVHLAVFHGTLGDWAGDRSLPLDTGALAAAGYDYVALGHIHQHQVHKLGQTLAVYAGAAEGKGFDDPGTGALTLVRVEPGAAAVWAEPLPVQPVATVDLEATGCAGPAELEAEIARHAHPDKILRVRLRGAPAFALDPEGLAAGLAPRFFYLEIADATEVLAPALLDQWAEQPTILGQFIRRLRAQLAAADEQEQQMLQRALRRGVAALRGGGGR